MNNVLVTQGDIAGISWPLLLAMLRDRSLPARFRKQLPRLVVVGHLYAQDRQAVTTLFDTVPFRDLETSLGILSGRKATKKPLFLYKESSGQYQPGRPGIRLAARSFENFEHSLQIFKELQGSSLVTLPVSKEWIMKARIDFKGHTEILAAKFKRRVFMCLYHPELSVIPLTNHIPLRRVAASLQKVDYAALGQAVRFFLKLNDDERPVAFLGLNPHAGEGGRIGAEEAFLAVKMNALKKKGLNIDGILAADGFFSPHGRSGYALAVACYHDQALAPFKALYGTEGINITLNLPRLRVSPDHGPAYSLAASGRADPKSILYSIRFAIEKGQTWTQLSSSPSLPG